MAIDCAEKRRAAFNCLLTPWVVLPISTGEIRDEDRAMTQGVYFPGAFPCAPMDDKLVPNTMGMNSQMRMGI